MKKIFNLLIVCLFTFTFLMCSEVKAQYWVDSSCYDSPQNSTYCDVEIGTIEAITDFEIRIGTIDRIKSINTTIQGAEIHPTANGMIARYVQSADPLDKKVIAQGEFIFIRYEISNDFLAANWPTQYPTIENVARYQIPIEGFAYEAPIFDSVFDPDGSYHSTILNFSNHPAYIDIQFNKYADLNHDAYINKSDITFLKNYLRNKDANTILSERPLDFLRADVNYDRLVNEDDLEAIYSYIHNNPSGTLLNNPLPNQTITLYGDANLDGIVNEEDVILILNHTSGNPLIFSQSKTNSDVNNDGIIDVVDAYLVRNQLMGTNTSTPLNDKIYYYGDVNLDNKVGFSDITKLISLRYPSESNNGWTQEILNTLEMPEGKTPGFSEIISLIEYVYEPHNITYNLDGGTEGEDTYVESFSSSKLPNNLPTPIKEGYYFNYWISDTESFNGYDLTGNVIKVVNKDIVYKAIWERDML